MLLEKDQEPILLMVQLDLQMAIAIKQYYKIYSAVIRAFLDSVVNKVLRLFVFMLIKMEKLYAKSLFSLRIFHDWTNVR